MFNGKSLTPDEYVENFRKLIEMSWDHVTSIDAYPGDYRFDVGEAVGDWLQMQWEYLVERMLRSTGQLDGYLDCYGEGTDMRSCRYSDVDAVATHRFCIQPRDGSSLHELIGGKLITFPEGGLPFYQFVSFDGWPATIPPFDHVIVEGMREELDMEFDLVFRLDDVQFSLARITGYEDFKWPHLTRRALFILVEDEIRRFQDPAVASLVRTLLIEPVDESGYDSDKAPVRITMVVRTEGDVTIGYRHTFDEAKWAVFHPDPKSPPYYTLGPETRWHVHLEDALNSSPAWKG